jgi:NADH dehydrogenase/NADH:ubiquinone oxidoreductase subunit G
MISLTINGKTLEVPEGTTVLRAAEQAGITIPTLCDHPDLTPYGGCRLCLVEVKGARLPMTSCTLAATQGMVVETETPDLAKHRRTILEMLLSNYHDPKALQSNGSKSGKGSDSDPNPFVRVDMNKCILCTRCVRACSEIQGRFVWSQAERGFNTKIVAGAGTDMLDARCESCGACVAYCPTGALENKMSINWCT